MCVCVFRVKSGRVFLLNYSLVLSNYLHFYILQSDYFCSSVHLSFTTSVMNTYFSSIYSKSLSFFLSLFFIFLFYWFKSARKALPDIKKVHNLKHWKNRSVHYQIKIAPELAVEQVRKTLFKIIAIREWNWTQLPWNKKQEDF